jgi:hypothetical protein
MAGREFTPPSELPTAAMNGLDAFGLVTPHLPGQRCPSFVVLSCGITLPCIWLPLRV